MSELNLKPTHAAVKNYYVALNQLGQLHIDHEMAVRSAFQYLLSSSGRKLKLTLVPEFEIKRKHSSIRGCAASRKFCKGNSAARSATNFQRCLSYCTDQSGHSPLPGFPQMRMGALLVFSV